MTELVREVAVSEIAIPCHPQPRKRREGFGTALSGSGIEGLRGSVDMSNSEHIKPPWWLRPAAKPVNWIVIGISRLGLRLGAERPMVLTVPGRKSGKLRLTPITPMTIDGNRYVVESFPGSDWALNARVAGEATLQRGSLIERVEWWSCPARTPVPCCGRSRPGCRAASGS